MSFLLVHSPAVGPSTWRWVAAALRSRGHQVVVPDLVAEAVSGDPALFARAAAAASETGDEVVIVGHSASGGLLPLVAELTPRVRRVVFVDASVPPCEGIFCAGGDLLVALRAIATNGVLPVWSRWWGEGMLQVLVRDDARRREVEGELPAVPLEFFEAPIEAPAGWCAREGAFLLLSEFYRSGADRAALLGWPVSELPGAHLDIANDEEAVAAALVELGAARDQRSPGSEINQPGSSA